MSLNAAALEYTPSFLKIPKKASAAIITKSDRSATYARDIDNKKMNNINMNNSNENKTEAAASNESTFFLHNNNNNNVTEAQKDKKETKMEMLLPMTTFEFVFAVLTWNVDLLLLLSAQAECPLAISNKSDVEHLVICNENNNKSKNNHNNDNSVIATWSEWLFKRKDEGERKNEETAVNHDDINNNNNNSQSETEIWRKKNPLTCKPFATNNNNDNNKNNNNGYLKQKYDASEDGNNNKYTYDAAFPSLNLFLIHHEQQRNSKEDKENCLKEKENNNNNNNNNFQNKRQQRQFCSAPEPLPALQDLQKTDKEKDSWGQAHHHRKKRKTQKIIKVYELSCVEGLNQKYIKILKDHANTEEDDWSYFYNNNNNNNSFNGHDEDELSLSLFDFDALNVNTRNYIINESSQNDENNSDNDNNNNTNSNKKKTTKRKQKKEMLCQHSLFFGSHEFTYDNESFQKLKKKEYTHCSHNADKKENNDDKSVSHYYFKRQRSFHCASVNSNNINNGNDADSPSVQKAIKKQVPEGGASEKKNTEQADQTHKTSIRFFLQKMFRSFFIVFIKQIEMNNKRDNLGDNNKTINSDGMRKGKTEAKALLFFNHHFSHFKQIIETYVMQNGKEVVRRGAQCISYKNENDIYNNNNNNNNLHSTDTMTDDTQDNKSVKDETQVYISGKDAAWQPLLLELLNIDKVVQCYAEPVHDNNNNNNNNNNNKVTHSELISVSLRLFLEESVSFFEHKREDGKKVDGTQYEEIENDLFLDYLMPLLYPTTSFNSEDKESKMDSKQVSSSSFLLSPLEWKLESIVPVYTTNSSSHHHNNNNNNNNNNFIALLTSTLPLTRKKITKIVLPAEDTETFDLSLFFRKDIFDFMLKKEVTPFVLFSPSAAEALSSASDKEKTKHNGNCLVHCSAGMHRSAGIAAAYFLYLHYCYRQQPSVYSNNNNYHHRTNKYNNNCNDNNCEHTNNKNSFCFTASSPSFSVLSSVLQHIKKQRSIADPIDHVKELLQIYESQFLFWHQQN